MFFYESKSFVWYLFMVLKSRSALVSMALRCKTPTPIVVEVYHTMSDGLGSIGSRFPYRIQSTVSEIQRTIADIAII